jgi:hypothetical protein
MKNVSFSFYRILILREENSVQDVALLKFLNFKYVVKNLPVPFSKKQFPNVSKNV